MYAVFVNLLNKLIPIVLLVYFLGFSKLIMIPSANRFFSCKIKFYVILFCSCIIELSNIFSAILNRIESLQPKCRWPWVGDMTNYTVLIRY